MAELTDRSSTELEAPSERKRAYVPRAQRAQATRLAIVSAAREQLTEHGLRATTMDAVAMRAGVHVQTLYRHFPNKAALLNAINEDEFQAFRAAIEDPNRTKGVIETFRDRSIENLRDMSPGFLESVFSIAADPLSGVSFANVYREFEAVLARALARELGFTLEDHEPHLIASMLWWGNFSLVERLRQTATKDELISEIVALTAKVESMVSALAGEKSRRKRAKR